MITHITKDKVLEVFHNEFCSMGNELGWKPERLPVRVGTDLGNRQPFVFVKFEDDTARYQQTNGHLWLVVFL